VKTLIPEYICPYLSNLFNKCWNIQVNERPSTVDLLTNEFENNLFKENFNFSKKYWSSLWDQFSDDQEVIDFNDFFVKFCDYFKILVEQDSVEYNCLKFVFISPSRKGKVLMYDYYAAIYWITDAIFPGWGIVKSITNNVQCNWYFINATTAEESKFISKKHQFMVRYSKKLDSLVIVFKKARKKKQFKHIKVGNPYTLHKRVKKTEKKHTLKAISHQKHFPEFKEQHVHLEAQFLIPLPSNMKVIY